MTDNLQEEGKKIGTDSPIYQKKHNFFNNMHHLTNNIFNLENYVSVKGKIRPSRRNDNMLHVRKGSQLETLIKDDLNSSFIKKMEICNKYTTEPDIPSEAPTAVYNNLQNFNKNKTEIEDFVNKLPNDHKNTLPPINNLRPPKIPNYKLQNLQNKPTLINHRPEIHNKMPTKHRVCSADAINRKVNTAHITPDSSGNTYINNEFFYHKNNQMVKNRILDSLSRQKDNQELYKNNVMRLNHQKEQEITDFIDNEVSKKQKKDNFDFYLYLQKKKEMEKVYQDVLLVQMKEKQLKQEEFKINQRFSVDSMSSYVSRSILLLFSLVKD